MGREQKGVIKKNMAKLLMVFAIIIAIAGIAFATVTVLIPEIINNKNEEYVGVSNVTAIRNEEGNIEVQIEAEEGGEIYISINGEKPSENSNWQEYKAGETYIVEDENEEVQTVSVYYRSAGMVSEGVATYALTPRSGDIAVAIYSETDNSLTFTHMDKLVSGDSGDLYGNKVITEIFTGFEEANYFYRQGVYGTESGVPWHDLRYNVQKIYFDDEIMPISTCGWFSDFYYLTEIDLSGLNTSNVTDMSYMFYDCRSLTNLDLTVLDTRNASDMSSMFLGCYNLQEIILGEQFDFTGSGDNIATTLPTPSGENIEGADGKWYNIETKQGYTPEELAISHSGETARYVAVLKEDKTALVMEWTIPAKDFASGDVTIKLPVRGSVNITVDWGDGTSGEVSGAIAEENMPTHTYVNNTGEDKKYDITIKGKVQYFGKSYANNYSKPPVSGDVFYTFTQYITGLKQWGELNAQSYGFSFCENLKYVSGDATENTLKSVKNMKWTFRECKSLESIDLSGLNTSTIESMQGIFQICPNLTNINFGENFDTSNVTDMTSMFSNCTSLTNINFGKGFKTSKVTNMSHMFDGCTKLMSVDVSGFDTSNVKQMTAMFQGSALTNLDLSNFNMQNVTHMNSMFSECKTLVSIVFSENIDTSNVTHMIYMFYNCKALKSLDLSTFNTLNVIDMTAMFYECNSLKTLNISGFNTEKVTSMQAMFDGCYALENLNLSSFDTSNVTNMNSMFAECKAIKKLDLSNFNTAKVTDMRTMFSSCEALEEINVSSFNTEKVTDMYQMFAACKKLKTLDLSSFYIPALLDFGAIFFQCESLEYVDISNFDTSDTTSFLAIFARCYKLKSVDISNFDTQKATTMQMMFAYCNDLEMIIASNKFVTPKSVTNMFVDTNNLSKIVMISKEVSKDQFATVVGNVSNKTFYVPNDSVTAYENVWNDSLQIKPILELSGDTNVTIIEGDTYTDAGYTVAGYGIENSGEYSLYGYDVISTSDLDTKTPGEYNVIYILDRMLKDGTSELNIGVVTRNIEVDVKPHKKMITEWTIPAEDFVSGEATIKLPVTGAVNITVDWGDGNVEKISGTISEENMPLHTYVNETGTDKKYDITIKGTVGYFGMIGLYSDANGAPLAAPEDSEYFTYRKYITGLKQWGELKTKSYGFSYCENLKYVSGDATEKTFENVTTMWAMFYNCTSLKSIDLSQIDTSNVNSLHCTFYNCTNLENLNLSNINTVKVTGMGSLFNNCQKLKTLDLTSFDTSSVKSMNHMFHNCLLLKEIKLDKNKFNTGNVTTMAYMFFNCDKITSINLSNFNTEKVTNMTSMFEECIALTSLDLRSFNAQNVTTMKNMFYNCTALNSIQIGDDFNPSKVTTMYGMFGRCSALKTLNLGNNFDTSSVTDMAVMFNNMTNLESINFGPKFNTQNVTTMQTMFTECNNLKTLDLSCFNTSKVQNTLQMFAKCTALESINFGENFNTSNLIDGAGMFMACSSLKELDLSNWNVSKVRNLGYMFSTCTALEYLNISNFETSNFVDYTYFGMNMKPFTATFANCKNLKSVLISNKFIIHGTQTNMLTGANSNLKFITISETPVANQFKGMITGNMNLYVPNDSLNVYVTTLSGDTSENNIKPILELSGDSNVTIVEGASYEDAGYTVAGYGIENSGDYNVYGYNVETESNVDTKTPGNYEIKYNLKRTYSGDSIVDDVAEVTRNIEVDVNPHKKMITEWTIPAEDFVSGEITVTLPVRGTVNLTVDWGDGTVEHVTTDYPTHKYVNDMGLDKKYDIIIKGTCAYWGSNYYEGGIIPEGHVWDTYTKYLTGLKQWGELGVYKYGFTYCSNLKYVSGDSTENTFKNVTNMEHIFSNCEALVSLDTSNFNTLNVTSMYAMFRRCKSLTNLDLTKFNTSNVKNMNLMFEDCSALTSLNLTTFDTSNVKEIGMYRMFANCSALTTLDLSSFTTEKVTGDGMFQMFSGCTSLKTLKLSNFDTSQITNMAYMFYNCNALTSLDLSSFNTSNVTDMQRMFNHCYALESLKLSEKFNTGKVQHMGWMFENCSSLETLDLSSFNTENVTDMGVMFYNCLSLTNLDVSTFDTTKVTNMGSMFRNCSALQSLDLSNFNTSSVTSMGAMFKECKELTSLNLSGWNTTNVEKMNEMFASCNNLAALDLSSFNTENVTAMNGMFSGCRKLKNLDISNFNTSNVTITSWMFSHCDALTSLDLSTFDTSKVTNTEGMFRDCSGLMYLDISGFDTSKVTNKSMMFMDSINLKSILVSNKFFMTEVEGSTYMFTNTPMLSKIIVTSKVPSGDQFGNVLSEASKITFYVPNDSVTAYEDAWNDSLQIKPILELSGASNVTIVEGTTYVDAGYTVAGYGIENSADYNVYGYNVETETDLDTKTPGDYEIKYNLKRAYSGDSIVDDVAEVTRNIEVDVNIHRKMITEWTIPKGTTEIKLPVTGTVNITVDWGDGKVDEISGEITEENMPTHTYVNASGTSKKYDITIKGTCDKWGSEYLVNEFVPNGHKWESYTRYLTGLKQWGELGVSRYGFSYCQNLKYVSGDSTENTFKNLTDCSYMFTFCSSLESIDLSNLDTSNVTNMAGMFNLYGRKLTSIDLSNLDTSNVTNMSYMFAYSYGLTNIDLSDFDTSNVTDMKYMFAACQGLASIDLSNFDTSNVTNMRYMFAACQGLAGIDLSCFNTTKVTNMSGMFSSCAMLESIDLSDFDTSNVTDMSVMFEYCSAITNLDLSGLNTSRVTDMSRMFRYCSALTNLDLSNFDTSIVTSMSCMFEYCISITNLDITNFNTSEVTDMSSMFVDCKVLKNLDLSNFDTSNVTNMGYMFYGCSSLTNLDLSNFNTKNVTNMFNMFCNCIALRTLDLSSFDITNEIYMDAMFKKCSNLKSILVSNKFITNGNVTSIFDTTSNLSKIILVSKAPSVDQFANVTTQIANITFYVPNEGLAAYRNAWTSITNKEKIKPILEVSKGDEYLTVGTSFEDTATYTVAGYEESEYKNYRVYGYKVEKMGEVDTYISNTYPRTYTLTRTYTNNGTETKEEVTKITRNIIVEESFAPKNLVASGDSLLNMTITFEKTEGTEVVIEVLNEAGEFETLTTNASMPFVIENLSENTAYEYRAYAIKDGRKSEYIYTTGHTPYEDIYLVISHDNIKPLISLIDVKPKVEYVSKVDTLNVTFSVTDRTYNKETSNILPEDIVIKVAEEVNNDVIKTLTKVDNESGETYTLTITNITGTGNVTVTIPKEKVTDKAGNKNDETVFDLNTYAMADPISDDAPTVTINENIIKVTSNQMSIFEIQKVIYKYRESGDTEYITSENNEITLPNSDTYYEVITVTYDVKGNVKESKITTVKTAAMDNSKIAITGTPTEYTSGDVTVTINFGETNYTKEYSLDGVIWKKVLEAETNVIVKENKVVYARISDEEKSTESITYAVENIDKEKPVIGSVTILPEGTANSKIIHVLDSKDMGVSGIKGFHVSEKLDLSNVEWAPLSASHFAYEATQNTTYYIWAIDNVGNISEAKSITVTGLVQKVDDISVPGYIELKIGEEVEIEMSYTGVPKDITFEVADESIIKVHDDIKTIEGLYSGDTTLKVRVTNYDDTYVEKEIKVKVNPLTLLVVTTSDGEIYGGQWTKNDVIAMISSNGINPPEYKYKINEDGEWVVIKIEEIINAHAKTTFTNDCNGNFYFGGFKDGKIITSLTPLNRKTIKIDKTAPEVGTPEINIDTNEINVKVNGATDAGSGIKEYEFSIYKDGKLLETSTSTNGETIFTGLTSSTTYSLEYKIIDNVGNETEVVSILDVRTKELIKVVTYMVDGVKFKEVETVAGTLVDLSITKEKEGYAFKGWATKANGEIIKSLIMPEEDITLYAIYKDETSPIIKNHTYETIDGKLILTLEAEDEGSGIDKYSVTINENVPGEWKDVNKDENDNLVITLPGTNKYKIWVRDTEGNYTGYEQVAIKDIFAPTGTIEVIGNNNVDGLEYSNIHDVKLKITAEDNESKDEDIMIAVYNEEEYVMIRNYSEIVWQTNYEENLELPWTTSAGDGLKRVYVIFKDKAGNISMTIKDVENVPTAEYKVKYYIQNIEGTAYELYGEEKKSGRFDTNLSLNGVVKVIAGTTYQKTAYTLNGEDIGTTFMVSEDGTTELYVYYIRNKMNVTFESEGVFLEKKEITYGDTYGELPTLEKEGYTFKGWYTDVAGGEKVESTTIVTSSKTLYAQWQINTYTITFNADGGNDVEPMSVEYNGEVTKPAAPMKLGYRFKAWVPELPETMPAENIEVTATWTPNEYTVRFEANGGNIYDLGDSWTERTVTYGEKYGTLPEVEERIGYIFKGWYTSGDEETLITEETITTTAAEGLVAYAKWELVEYTITYNLDGGTVSEQNPTTYTIETETIILTNPTKEGYEFKGWISIANEPQTTLRIPKGTTGNKEYTAIWIEEMEPVSLASVVEIGDYVNYPVEYDNVPTRDGGYTASLNGWRVLDVSENVVKIVSAGAPLTYKDTSRFNKDLIDNFFITTYKSSGFDKTKTLEEVFNNEYTNVVTALTKEEAEKVYDPTGATTLDNKYIAGDLLLPPNTDGSGGIYYWLPSTNSTSRWRVYPSGTVKTSSDATFGVRVVVTLNTNVFTTGKDATGAWNIEVLEEKLITFTIDGITYQAKEGMTWEEWVDSIYCGGKYIIHPAGGAITESDSPAAIWCDPKTVIKEGDVYYTDM